MQVFFDRSTGRIDKDHILLAGFYKYLPNVTLRRRYYGIYPGLALQEVKYGKAVAFVV
jgi:hypothetical protein